MRGKAQPRRSSGPHAPPGYGFGADTAGLLPWSPAQQRLQDARNFWIGTIRPDGRPHVTPVWGLWLDVALYFGGLPTARWARNLAERPSAIVHLESGDDVVILEGEIDRFVANEELAERIVTAWIGKYGRLAPQATKGVFRFVPRSARAWRDWSLRDGTRWRLS